jgi:penicillin-binding protein 2
LLGAAETAGFSLIAWRLFELQVLESQRYAPMAEENRISLQVLPAERGRLLDDLGRPLADNEEMFRATVTPALVKDVGQALQRVQKILPLTDDEVAKLIVRAKKQGRNVPTVIATDLTFDQVAKLSVLAPNLPGIQTETGSRRRYHGGAAIGHVVGFIGDVERYGVDDDETLRLPDARIGKCGAEAGFEPDLKGTSGTQKIEVDARGHVVRNLETIEPVPGRDVALSIDLDLQNTIWNRIRRERLAAGVVLNVQTGAVVAMVSTPGFDPAVIAGGISEGDWWALSTAPDKPLLNRAIAGQYQPGATFKLVTALAALDSGSVAADERVECTGSYEYADQTYRCWKPSGHGKLTLHEALCCSCDVFFFEMARRVGIKKIAAAARRLGLGASYDIGLIEEKAGVVPDPDWKRGNLNAAWLGGETLIAGAGQGYVQTTPLQLAVMTARIASGGEMLPRLLNRDASAPKQVFSPLSFSALHLDIVRKAMIAAVNDEKGTGGNAKLGENRPLVAGKTGTSQVSRLSSETAEDDLAWPRRDHSVFVGYVPADAPRYAVATVVEHGGAGDAAAAPLARDILNLVLDRDGKARTGSDSSGGGNEPLKATSESAG